MCFLSILPTVIINDIDFDKNGKAVVKEDFQGIDLKAVTLPWSPYIIISNCNSAGLRCEYSGYLIELMEIWGKNLNFTMTIDQDPTGDWGTTPKSGTYSQAKLDILSILKSISISLKIRPL